MTDQNAETLLHSQEHLTFIVLYKTEFLDLPIIVKLIHREISNGDSSVKSRILFKGHAAFFIFLFFGRRGIGGKPLLRLR